MGHLKFKDRLASVEAGASGPAKRLFQKGGDGTDAFKDVKTLPLQANGATAVIERVGAFDQERGDAVPG
jgi:hypothetical protein